MEELVGLPETLVVNSTLLPVLHTRQAKQSAVCFEGEAWAKWGTFVVYEVKLHFVCSPNRVPFSYALTAATFAPVLLVPGLLARAGLE